MTEFEQESLPPNMYSLLVDTNNKNILNKLEFDEEDEFSPNTSKSSDGVEYENFFILDHKLREQRNKRLNEKDKLYKIKKHYYLKDSYTQMEKKEMLKVELERSIEKEYLDNCYKAEYKLYRGHLLESKDIKFLIKRNYQIFSKSHRNDIRLIRTLFDSLYIGSIVGTFLLFTYFRTVMLYFKFEIISKKISFFFLGIYGVGIYFSFNHFIDISYVNKMQKFCFHYRDKILDVKNENLKTPYNRDERNYKPLEEINEINKF